MSAFDVIVVGAGIGGLATAMRVAATGSRVAVVERSDDVGGKMRTVAVAGRPIDSGPTVMTMKPVFDDLFETCGFRLAEFVELHPLDILARHAWSDGSRLDLFRDARRTAAAIEQFAGPKEADGYRRFSTHAANIHGRVESVFMGAPKDSMFRIAARAGLRGAMGLLRVDWHRSLWNSLGTFFADPRLRQLFARYATYYGSSPFQAPGTLSVIAHVEQQGVWRVAGGMQGLARGMAAALRSMGSEITTGTEVTELIVDRGRVGGVRLRGGGELRARAVVLNADPHAVTAGCFGEPARRAVRPAKASGSLSAITFGWVGRPRGFDLAYHTVFFSDDYEAEFRDIFDRRQVPAEPTVYVCAQDRGPVARVAGVERMFALINAPATGDQRDFRAEIPRWRDVTVGVLARRGLRIEGLEGERVTTPTDFAGMFPATAGALYGPATHSAMGAFARPGVRTALERLYLVGGGIHPGAGVPMVALGGRWAAAAVAQDLAADGGLGAQRVADVVALPR